GHQGDGRFAQKTQAAPPGRFLQHSDRLAIDNDLAQFIVKKQDFGDGGTPGVSGAAAAPAALAGDKVEVAYFGWIRVAQLGHARRSSRWARMPFSADTKL